MRLGVDMLTAVEKVDASLSGEAPPVVTPDTAVGVPGPGDNDLALAELTSMMRGLG